MISYMYELNTIIVNCDIQLKSLINLKYSTAHGCYKSLNNHFLASTDYYNKSYL